MGRTESGRRPHHEVDLGWPAELRRQPILGDYTWIRVNDGSSSSTWSKWKSRKTTCSTRKHFGRPDRLWRCHYHHPMVLNVNSIAGYGFTQMNLTSLFTPSPSFRPLMWHLFSSGDTHDVSTSPPPSLESVHKACDPFSENFDPTHMSHVRMHMHAMWIQSRISGKCTSSSWRMYTSWRLRSRVQINNHASGLEKIAAFQMGRNLGMKQ